MKITSIFIAIGITIWLGCSKDDDTDQIFQRTEIPFAGTWTRQFEAGPGNLHTVFYGIYRDSIRYTLTGPIGNADYVMLRDTFLPENNRFIDHTPENQLYLLFAKIISADTIKMYKQEVSGMEEGRSVPVPAPNTTANYGWGTYTRQ